MTPEEEMAVIIPDAITYKGVQFDLPKPVVDYIDGLIKSRNRAYQSMDVISAKYIESLNLPPSPPSPWVRVDGRS
jgi:hypothetical protein